MHFPRAPVRSENNNTTPISKEWTIAMYINANTRAYLCFLSCKVVKVPYSVYSSSFLIHLLALFRFNIFPINLISTKNPGDIVKDHLTADPYCTTWKFDFQFSREENVEHTICYQLNYVFDASASGWYRKPGVYQKPASSLLGDTALVTESN